MSGEPLHILPDYTSEVLKNTDKATLEQIFNTYGTQMFYVTHKEKPKSKFVPALLATYLQVTDPVVTIKPNETEIIKDYGEMWRWDWDEKMYVPNAQSYFLEKINKMWGDNFNTSLLGQTFTILRAETYIDREQFEFDVSLIPAKGCVLQLNSANINIIQANPSIYITNRIPVTYNPSAQCNKWLEFLSKTFDPPDIEFLQEWCGAIPLRKIFGVGKAVILVGPTRTGKGTFIYVVECLIGDSNTVKIPLQSLKETHERVRTYKKLLCTWADLDKIGLQESGYIKPLISGDSQSARHLYENSFDFRPFVKVLQSGNETPQTEIDRDDWWERFHVISVHTHQYFDDDPEFNPNLKAELTTPEELSGILNWALEGLLRYIRNGYRFSNCPDWKETRKRWLLWGDPINAFMESGWVEFDRNEETIKQSLFDHFLRFCAVTGRRELITMSKFGRLIVERYVKTGQIQDARASFALSDGSRLTAWRGIGIVHQ